MLEFQSFTFMNGQDAYSVAYIALDSLATDSFVPFAYEGVNIRRIVLRKLVQLVVEGADIRTLLV